MTDQRFRVVLRGYEMGQVDKRLVELAKAADEARAYADELAERVRMLESQPLAGAIGERPGQGTLEQFGQRVAEIFRLAEAEARDLLACGRAALEEEVRQVSAEVSRRRNEADHEAQQVLHDAETQAAWLLGEARRTAEERVDAAERDAAGRLQEAATAYERRLALAAQVAADFETTLVRRRAAAEQDFASQVHEHQHRLAELASHTEAVRTRAEQLHDQALQDRRRILEHAEKQAAAILGDARAEADRARADSDQELAAAMQRRDRINAQLANVRQKLATLTDKDTVPVQDEDLTGRAPASL